MSDAEMSTFLVKCGFEGALDIGAQLIEYYHGVGAFGDALEILETINLGKNLYSFAKKGLFIVNDMAEAVANMAYYRRQRDLETERAANESRAPIYFDKNFYSVKISDRLYTEKSKDGVIQSDIIYSARYKRC